MVSPKDLPFSKFCGECTRQWVRHVVEVQQQLELAFQSSKCFLISHNDCHKRKICGVSGCRGLPNSTPSKVPQSTICIYSNTLRDAGNPTDHLCSMCCTLRFIAIYLFFRHRRPQACGKSFINGNYVRRTPWLVPAYVALFKTITSHLCNLFDVPVSMCQPLTCWCLGLFH
jgi:hypothetical protein